MTHIFVPVPELNIEVTPYLVKQGAFGLSPKGLTRTDISALDAEDYAASVGCRLLTSDEWDVLLAANILEVTIGDMYEWTSTIVKSLRVSRGGSWSSDPVFARVAYRSLSTPAHSIGNLGFRLVRDVKP